MRSASPRLFLFVLALGGCPREKTPPPITDDRESFREELIAEARRQAPDASVRLGATVEEVTIDGKSVFLGNMYLASREPGASREATIRNTVTALLMPSIEAVISEDFAVARHHLLPRVRDLASRGIGALDMELRTDAGVTDAVERALTDHLREVLVFDHSSSVIDVPRFLAAKWARSDDELFQLARENLEHRSTPLVEEGGWLVAHERDTFDAARVLLVDRHGTSLHGRPVAFVLDRDTLLLAGEDDVATLTRACEQAAQRQGAYPISLQPIVRTDGGWERWLPTNRALAGRVAALRRLEQRAVYSEQKALLDTLHERNRVEVVVADVMEQNGRTFGTWSSGVRTWLAETDDIAFFSGTEAKPVVRIASQASALKVMGAAMRRVPALEPVRWEVDSFPTEQQLRAMKATLRKKEGSVVRSE